MMEAPREREKTKDKAPRILIVDDHEDNVELLRARLEAWGYRPETATDGAEALEKVEKAPPDLILLDVMMPKMDGIEVARRIKGNESLPFIPIIIGEGGQDWPAVAAGTTFFLVPIVVFTVLLRKHLLRGITFGAVRK